MGDPAAADDALLPDLFYLRSEAGYSRVTAYIHTLANYELMADNILDLSHVPFVHRSTFAADEASAAVKPRVRQDDTRVFYERSFPRQLPHPMFAALFEIDEPVEAWSDVVWQPPALMTHIFGMAPAGRPREGARELRNLHFMTPESDRSTHYFWAGARSFRVDEADIDKRALSLAEGAFAGEDKPMIEAQQAMMGDADFWSLKPLLLRGDAAGVLARRVLAKLIAAERGGGDRDAPPLAGVTGAEAITAAA